MEPLAKKGWKTTEFWLTIATLVVSLMVGGGVLSLSEGDQATNVAGQIITAIINAVGLVYYIKRRTEQKEVQAVLVAQNPDLCSACGKVLDKKENHGHG